MKKRVIALWNEVKESTRSSKGLDVNEWVKLNRMLQNLFQELKEGEEITPKELYRRAELLAEKIIKLNNPDHSFYNEIGGKLYKKHQSELWKISYYKGLEEITISTSIEPGHWTALKPYWEVWFVIDRSWFPKTEWVLDIRIWNWEMRVNWNKIPKEKIATSMKGIAQEIEKMIEDYKVDRKESAEIRAQVQKELQAEEEEKERLSAERDLKDFLSS